MANSSSPISAATTWHTHCLSEISGCAVAHTQVYKEHYCDRLLERASYAAVAIDTYKINGRWGS